MSATMPKVLVDFAKAGLHNPTLLRLDTETKISDVRNTIENFDDFFEN